MCTTNLQTWMNVCEEVHSLVSQNVRLYRNKNYRPSDNPAQTFAKDAVYLDILKASIDSKCPLVSNGGRQNYRNLKCKDFFRTARSKKDAGDGTTNRHTSLTNDRQNNRPSGKVGARKTSQADTSDGKCNFLLQVKWDDLGYTSST